LFQLYSVIYSVLGKKINERRAVRVLTKVQVMYLIGFVSNTPLIKKTSGRGLIDPALIQHILLQNHYKDQL